MVMGSSTEWLTNIFLPNYGPNSRTMESTFTTHSGYIFPVSPISWWPHCFFFHCECDQSGARALVSFHKSSSRNWHPADLTLTQRIVKQCRASCQFGNQRVGGLKPSILTWKSCHHFLSTLSLIGFICGMRKSNLVQNVLSGWQTT